MIKRYILAFLVLMALCLSASFASANEWGVDLNSDDSDGFEELTGDTKYACEAILCLSSTSRPSECDPALNRYYSIKKKKWSKTVKARKNFLNLCPSASADENMVSLTSSIAYAAGECDAAALNNRGDWVEITERVSKQGQNISGDKYTVTYTAVSDENGYSSYYIKTTRYWKVNESTPQVCLDLWNHQYTDYSVRPRVVYGSQPWETKWIDQ